MGPRKKYEVLVLCILLGVIPGAVAVLAAIAMPIVQWLAK
jgi:hypothetical protein